LATDAEAAFAGWRQEWRDGCIKLAATRALLALRAREAALFAAGDYAPCEVTGPRADEIVAFARRHEQRCVLTAVQRFPVRAERSRDWRGTRIHAPPGAVPVVDALTRRPLRGEALDPAEVFATLPIAVLAGAGDG
jgi:(1->4)-alpha-D-glucan 1-alpha-D-glucosylmutase